MSNTPRTSGVGPDALVRKQREPQQRSPPPRLLGETAIGVCSLGELSIGFPGRDDAARQRAVSELR
jgi:hypothetical protein